MLADRGVKPLLYYGLRTNDVVVVVVKDLLIEEQDLSDQVSTKGGGRWGTQLCLFFVPMDGPTYTVERQTKTYVTRYVGMSLFWLPMDKA